MTEGEVINPTEGTSSIPLSTPDRAIPATARRATKAHVITSRLPVVTATIQEPTATTVDGTGSSIGEQIKVWREKHGYTLVDIAREAGRSGELLRLIEEGKMGLSLQTIVQLKGALARIGQNDVEAVALRDALEEIEARMRPEEGLRMSEEETNWLRTLKRPDMTFSLGLQYLRFSIGLSQQDFAKKTGLSTISEYEKIGVIPSPHNLEMILRAAGLDVDDKHAQFIRLLGSATEEYPSHRIQQPEVSHLLEEKGFVWSVNDLRTCTIGQLMRYARIAHGLTIEEFIKQSGIGAAFEIEAGLHTGITRVNQDKFIAWLNLSANSTLTKVIHSKDNRPNVQDDIPYNDLQQILGEGILFKEHLDAIPEYPLSVDDERLLSGLLQLDSFQEKVIVLTKRKQGTEDTEIRDAFWSSPRAFKKYIRILYNPDSQIRNVFQVVSLLRVYGYDINHPITWHLLDFIRDQKSAGSANGGTAQE